MNLDEVLQRVEGIFEREDGEEFAEHLIKTWRNKREIATLIGDQECVFKPLKRGVRVRGDGIKSFEKAMGREAETELTSLFTCYREAVEVNKRLYYYAFSPVSLFVTSHDREEISPVSLIVS